MTVRGKVTGGAVWLGLGQIAGQGMSFARSVIVARLLTTTDLGIAATFGLVIMFIDNVSNLGAERLLVQASDGDERRFQATAHALQAVRAAVCALIIVAAAGPVAALFGTPEAAWAYRWVALVPLLRGLAHLDQQRVNRDLRFKAQIWSDLGGQVFGLLAAWPLARYVGNYAAVLWILVGQTVVNAAVSHLLAERPYRWAWDMAYVRRFAAFGWPLTLNGAMLFAILQGDQTAIGVANHHYTKAQLGVYATAFGLALIPSVMVAKIATSLALPVLAAVTDDAAAFDRRYAGFCQAVALIALWVALPLIIAGGHAMTLIYGKEFAAAGGFIGLLAAMQAGRLCRIMPTLGAMAKAETKNMMISNAVRMSALVGVVIAASMGEPLHVLAMMGVIGEVLALLVSTGRLRRRQGVSVGACLRPAAYVGVCAAMAGGVRSALLGEPRLVAIAAGVAASGVATAGKLLVFPQVREEAARVLGAARRKLRGGALAGGAA